MLTGRVVFWPCSTLPRESPTRIDVYPAALQQRGKAGVVTGEHDDLATLGAHLAQFEQGDGFAVFLQVAHCCSSSRRQLTPFLCAAQGDFKGGSRKEGLVQVRSAYWVGQGPGWITGGERLKKS
jgi:hypothetical protein